MTSARLLAALMLLLPFSAHAEDGAHTENLARVDLRANSIEGCVGLPEARGERSLRISGDSVVDVDARYWTIDRPVAFKGGKGVASYRVGDGLLRVESTLSADLTEELTSIHVVREIGSEHLAIYLPGVSLPCERRTRYEVKPGEAEDGDLAQLAEFDASLHQAEELVYDQRFAEAEALLRRAMELRPQDPAPYWMMSRLRYLSTEAVADDLPASERVAAYEEAEDWADESVARAPQLAEGYLWQGIARGRIATSLGNVRLAVQGALGGRGPAWLEQTLRKAASKQDEFRFFGSSSRADALYALAQFYRLAPDSWYMTFVGTRGDLDRAIVLLRQAVELQPTRIEYRKELAVALLCRGRVEDVASARSVLQAILRLPTVTPIDRIDHEHARAMLDDGGDNICWYSRDGFQKADS